MIKNLFAWLRDLLGLGLDRQQSEWQYRQLETKLIEIQGQLNTMQKDKLKLYVNKQEAQRAPAPMDYEASQRATLEEFKEN